METARGWSTSSVFCLVAARTWISLSMCFLNRVWTWIWCLWLTDLHDNVDQGVGTPNINIPKAIIEELEQLPEAMSPDWYASYFHEDFTSS